MYNYCGPKGFGANPECGGSIEEGEYRVTSLEPFRSRLTNDIINQLREVFTLHGGTVVHVDKVYRQSTPYLRVTFNGKLWRQ